MRTLLERLADACTASCTCLTKTPDWTHHEANCRYRLLSEAVEQIESLQSERDEARGKVERLGAALHRYGVHNKNGKFDNGCSVWVTNGEKCDCGLGEYVGLAGVIATACRDYDRALAASDGQQE